LRILWGFAGSRYARFAQFVHAPAHTRQYAKSVANGVEPRHLGHNPLGAWMIVTLLATLVAICATGWLYTTDRFWGETWVENVHIAASYFVLALVALHVAGVIFSSLRHGENLVAAMLHGRKRAPGPGDVP
jgi:cytochrome b